MTRPKTAITANNRPAIGLGSLISIGAGVGLVAGILLGNLVFGLLFGAAAGTLVGSVVELYRRPASPAEPRTGQAPRPISLYWLVGCLVFLGVSALFGGLMLVGSPVSASSPSGAWYQIPLSVLEYSPFSDFLIPGLILGTVFGMGSFGTVLALWLRPAWPLGTSLTRFTGAHWAWSAAVTVGLGQIIWIVTETVMLRGASWLGAIYGSLGGKIVVLACLPGVRRHFALNAGHAPSRRPG